MKIALSLSGHMNNFCIDYKKRFDDVDVFLCTWDKIALNSNITTTIQDNIFKDYKIFNFELMQERHQFKYKTIEPYAKYTHPHKNRKGWDSYSIFFLQYQCGLLRKNYEIDKGFEYDMVIKFRPDQKFYIGEIPALEENTLYFPENSNFRGITDNLMFGKSSVMDKFTLLYLVMDVYTALHKCEWINEHLVKHHLDRLNIKTKTVEGFLYLGCNDIPPGGDQKLTQAQMDRINYLKLL